MTYFLQRTTQQMVLLIFLNVMSYPSWDPLMIDPLAQQHNSILIEQLWLVIIVHTEGIVYTDVSAGFSAPWSMTNTFSKKIRHNVSIYSQADTLTSNVN